MIQRSYIRETYAALKVTLTDALILDFVDDELSWGVGHPVIQIAQLNLAIKVTLGDSHIMSAFNKE